MQRQKPNNEDGFSLLQSMLYHSQQITTHYWLTPLLYTALAEKNKNVLYQKLRKFDNILFCTNDQRNLPERTWALMKEIDQNNLSVGRENLDILESSEGVNFPHYWFYKLEFVLWYKLKDKYPNWKNFRMTAKNSVEHVSL